MPKLRPRAAARCRTGLASAVLSMRFAALAARYFDSVEVIELHHPDK